MSILIIDENKRHSELLSIALKKAGYKDVITAGNSRELFQELDESSKGKKSEVDVILMDINMQGMTGFEACRLIKSSDHIRDIPIILLTTQSDPNTLKLIFGSGALDYVLKPVQTTVLLARIHSALQLKTETDIRKAREKELMETNQLLIQEKEKTDQLLCNILPQKIVRDLQAFGETKPELYKNVTVLFSDIVEFTKVSAMLDPESLIHELNEVFTGFDSLMEKHKCERIKTIGDAYLAVCGMPEANTNHAFNIVDAALSMVDFLNKRNSENLIQWKIRLGIHSGDVVGSVVGVKKYIFDIFGDTVNTASRMETNSEPMKINVSESTRNLVKDEFVFTERPSIMVKGKGKMNMFFVEGKQKKAMTEEMFNFSDLQNIFK